MDLFTRTVGRKWRDSKMPEIRNFQVYLLWHSPNMKESKMTSVVDEMTMLQHLELVWDCNDEDNSARWSTQFICRPN